MRAHFTTLALASAALLILSGCTDTTAPTNAASEPATTVAGDCLCPPPEAVVDPALLAFLSKAKALHHEADLAEDAHDDEAAIAALDRLTAGPQPQRQPPAPEVREVLADTFARSAALRSRDDYRGALKDVARGLALAPERSHYRGRLMEVLGVVEQRQFKRLEKAGDAAAAAAKERALKAFEEAVAIQDEVIQRALGGAHDAPE